MSQPQWSPQGVLHFLTDRTGWWNLYRWSGDRAAHTDAEPVAVVEAELGPAAWEFGYATYAFLPNGQIATTVQQGPRTWLAVTTSDGELERLPLRYTSIKPYLAADHGQLAIIGANLTHVSAVALVGLDTAECREITRAAAM